MLILIIIAVLSVATSIPFTDRKVIYLIIVILTVFFTQRFSYKVYPLISPTFGGGYPTEIHLLIDAGKVNKNQIKLL